MKKTTKKFFSTVSIIILALSGCSSGTFSAQNNQETEVESNDAYAQTLQDIEFIENALSSEMTSDTYGWLASNGDGIRIYIMDECINVTVRTISPHMLAKVCEEVCPIIQESANTLGYSEFSISVLYYTENGINGDWENVIQWKSEDGITGFLFDYNNKYTAFGLSINEVSEYIKSVY